MLIKSKCLGNNSNFNFKDFLLRGYINICLRGKKSYMEQTDKNLTTEERLAWQKVECFQKGLWKVQDS